MDKLTDRQRDSIARIYKEIADYLLVFEQADGFVAETVEKVGNTIQDALAVWNERNRG